MVKVAVIYYSTYGHIAAMAESEAQGLRDAGVDVVDVLQFPETLSSDVLKLMYAPGQDASKHKLVQISDLVEYDAFLFGIPTRFGSFPAQFKEFWDATAGLWMQGSLSGKYVGMFVSTGGLGGGQETTIRNSLSSFVHQGMLYVPLGYKTAFPQLTNIDEIHGGSPWGAGCLAGADGSRLPSPLEKEIAYIQGKSFGEIVSKAFPNNRAAEKTSVAQTAVSSVPASGATTVAATPVPKSEVPSRGATEKTPAKESTFQKCCVIV